jgi:hypothetical protein
VEITALSGRIAVRDTKNPQAGNPYFGRGAFADHWPTARPDD